MRQSGLGWGALRALALGALLLCGGALSSQAEAAPVNLVQNGDFTGTSLSSPGGYACNQASNSVCNSRLTSWSVTCGTNGCLGGGTPTSILSPGTNGSAWNGGNALYRMDDAPVSGNVFADDGDPAYRSSLSQTITGLTAGDTYTLSFYQAAAQQKGLSGATTEQWQVAFGTTQTSALMNNPSQGFVTWGQQTMTFVATQASQVLSFLALGTPAGQPPVVLLAGVSLLDTTAVPEPAALTLMGMGVFGLAAFRKARRRA